MSEFNYNASTIMQKGYPQIKKLGAVAPNAEMTPFVWNGKLMRLESVDPDHGLDASSHVDGAIRDVESGEIISHTAEGCYFLSAYIEGDTAFVIGVERKHRDTIRIYESKDLVHWSNRILFTNPGWVYYNSSLTKGPDGYVIAVEASQPEEYIGVPFTYFFATSPDLEEWTHMDYKLGFSKERYMGGAWMRYCDGWYYLISVTELPCQRYTNYLYRTKDFRDWYVGYYNPIIMPSEEDRIISSRAADLSDVLKEQIKTGFIISASDIDMCEYNGKIYMNYLVGNQLGFYYMAEAECEGTIEDFLKNFFE